ncbi:hypothetical protein C8J25_107279 [Sphingomonas faeni]|uniref:Phage P22-like portal protein n=1 Tax=Sphingomonas faeni TaxID=185950 RepID=A0A2T5U245_9SPHN|nr:hypothetical protein [Sphingomonas faeni]PTW45594.1 hypothetical protein C8J25_107279 [Sphingomonas faeni]
MEIENDGYKPPKSSDELRRLVDQYLNITRENSVKVRRDRDYFDGHQISGNMRKELEERGQPIMPVNKIAPGLSGLMGIMDAGVADPECWPRSPKSQAAADIATKTLRYVTDRAKYKKSRRQTSEIFLIQGSCAAITQWDGRHITIERIRWEDFIHDPLSREHDFSDAKFFGIAKLLDTSDVRARFPDTYDDLQSPKGDFGDFFDDQSKARWWSSPKRDQLRVVDLYYLVIDQWHRCVFTDGGSLYAGPSEYRDDLGQSISPINAMSFEVDLRGDRYGAVRNMVPLQDAINSRNSKLLHLLNHRQTQQTDMYAPAANKDIARREAAKADGTIPFGWAPIQAPDLAQGQMLLLQQAHSDLDRMAPTPAVLGRLSGAAESGRKAQILQQAGYTELARAFGRFEEFEKTIFEKAWFVARDYLDQPTMIRITDNPRAMEWTQINEPILGPVMQPVMDSATGEPVIDPVTGQPMTRVAMGVTGYKNRIAELDLDIIISTVPSNATLEQEVFETIMETASSLGISPLDPNFDGLLAFMPIPNKRETQDRLKQIRAETEQANAPQAQQQAQVAEAAQQLQAQALQAKTAKDAAHAQKTTVEAQQIELENHHIIDRSVMNAAYGTPFNSGIPLN